MGGCSSSLRAKVIPGIIRSMDRIDFDACDEEDYVELLGVPMQRFVESLGLPNKDDLIKRVMEAGQKPGPDGKPRPFWSRGMHCAAARIEVLSWNVGSLADGRSSRGAGIDENLRADVQLLLAGALGVGKGQRADVIVVGLQEVISLSIDNVVAGPPRSSFDCLVHQGWPETVVQWIDLIKDAINVHVDGEGSTRSRHNEQMYVLFGQPVYLFGNLLCVFCLPELVGTHIHQFSMFEMPADRHESGVKGVVACRFSLYDRSFCFINCHFNADSSSKDEHGKRDLDERIQQMQTCLRSIEFRLNDQLLHPLAAHRAVFLLGDTNMRLTRPANFDSWGTWKKHVEKSIEAGDFKSLAVHDQLQAALGDPSQMLYVVGGNMSALATAAGRRARALREASPHGGGPSFAPTYKLAVPGPGYSEKRVPAWTDRILYRSSDVRPVCYEAVDQQQVLRPPRNITDHNPIYGLFEVDCVRINKGVLQMQVRNSLGKGGASSSSDRVEHLTGEQERHFRWRFVNTGRPHIELLAQRLFDVLKTELDGQELTVAADKLVRAQQHCWRLVCDHMEEKLYKSLKGQHDHFAAELLEGTLHELSRDLQEALDKHEALDRAAVPRAEAPPMPRQRSELRPAPEMRRQRRRVCIRCWAPCYEGLWQWSR